MSLASIIYHNPTDFHLHLSAYPIPQRRRGLIFATLMGFDISKTDVPLDMMTQITIKTITETPMNDCLPSWVPTYTFGFETPFSKLRLGPKPTIIPPISPAPMATRFNRVISTTTPPMATDRMTADAMAAARADGSPSGMAVTVIRVSRPTPKPGLTATSAYDVTFIFV